MPLLVRCLLRPLQHLVKFEDMIGVEFTHIRLLAKSLTMKNVGFNNLTWSVHVHPATEMYCNTETGNASYIYPMFNTVSFYQHIIVIFVQWTQPKVRVSGRYHSTADHVCIFVSTLPHSSRRSFVSKSR